MGAPHTPLCKKQKGAAIKRLLKAAEARGMTSIHLANALAVGVGTINRWRLGHLPHATLEKIEEAITVLRAGGRCPSLGNGETTYRRITAPLPIPKGDNSTQEATAPATAKAVRDMQALAELMLAALSSEVLLAELGRRLNSVRTPG